MVDDCTLQAILRFCMSLHIAAFGVCSASVVPEDCDLRQVHIA